MNNTREELIQIISRNLEDEAGLHFTQDEILDSMYDAYVEIALLTGCVEKMSWLYIPAETNYVNLRKAFPDYFSIWAIFNLNNNLWLEPNAYRQFKDTSARWETIFGEPRFWAPLGWDYIAIFPKRKTVGKSFGFFYNAIPSPLVYGERPQIPDTHDCAIEFYVTGDLLDQNLEFTKAMKYYTKYTNEIKEIKEYMSSRSLPDRIFMLTEKYSGVER